MDGPKGAVLITGANGGLGAALVKEVQSSSSPFAGYHGLYTVRHADSAPALRTTLDNLPPHPHHVVDLDLADLASVRRAAATMNARVASGEIPPIKLLILNAGFQDFGKQAWTSGGLDQTFSANYLGHWLLTLLLLQSIDKLSGGIVIIGSQGHDPHDPRNNSSQAFVSDTYKTLVPTRESIDAIAKGTWSSAKEDPSWRSGFRRYGASKLFLVMMVHELQRRLDMDPTLNQIFLAGVDPGTMGTGLQRHAPWIIRVLIFQIVYPIVRWLAPNGLVRSPQKSAAQVVYAATRVDSEGKAPKHAYYFDDAALETSAEAKDVEKCNWVWQKSIEYTQLSQEETVLREWK